LAAFYYFLNDVRILSQVHDENGIRRFHGAFTGGFSAGYFNSVGTKEGLDEATQLTLLVFDILTFIEFFVVCLFVEQQDGSHRRSSRHDQNAPKLNKM
jgi:hypothetical protein